MASTIPSTTISVDYIATSFEFATLTKVHSVPDYGLLREIKNELKSNSSKVQCDLGGGDDGHLGLVLTDAEYTSVNAKAYIRPVHPGDLVQTGATPFDKQVEREEHWEKLRIF